MNARPTGWDGRSARCAGRLAQGKSSPPLAFDAAGHHGFGRDRGNRHDERTGAGRRPCGTSRGDRPGGRAGRFRSDCRDDRNRAGRVVGRACVPRSRLLVLENGSERADLTGHGRNGPGARDARCFTIADPDARRCSHLPARIAEEILREMLKLKGTWSSMQTLESTVNGVPQKSRQFKMLWSIDRDTIKDTGEDGFAARTFRYILDLKKEPKNIDLTLLNSGLTLYGIYKLEENSLTVCWGAGERPKDFEARPSQYRMLAQFQRESRNPTQLPQECPNTPGCYWAVEPRGAVPGSVYTNGIDLIVKNDHQGAMVVILAYVTKFQGDTPDLEYHPVAFDDKRVGHHLKVVQGGSSRIGLD